MTQKIDKTSLANHLAKERSREASDRTLMAWIRTAISLIGFGFAIAKSYEYVELDYMAKTGKILDAVHAPTIFGTSFIILGILGLIAGIIQYGRILRRLGSDEFTYADPFPLPKILAILLVVIGAFGIWAILS